MAVQLSVAVRNARLDQIEAVAGPSAVLKIFTGAPPASCAAANSGAVLATLMLPVDWMAGAGGGTKEKAGTWEDVNADASGIAGHFRVFNTDMDTCHIQGTVGVGSGDLQLDSVNITQNQRVTITGFTLSDGNA